MMTNKLKSLVINNHVNNSEPFGQQKYSTRIFYLKELTQGKYIRHFFMKNYYFNKIEKKCSLERLRDLNIKFNSRWTNCRQNYKKK